VAEFKFRLQATEDNVATFLHILSTVHSELSSDPAGYTLGEAFDTETDSMLRQAAAKHKEEERRGLVENKEREEQKVKCWDD
jgi:hypothetical protein